MLVVDHGATFETPDLACKFSTSGRDVIDQPTMLTDRSSRDYPAVLKALGSYLWLYRHLQLYFSSCDIVSSERQIELFIGILRPGIH